MSSEDDYYYDYRYDRRSSKRPRRRASSPRRYRQFDSDYIPRKSRREKHPYKNHAPRMVGVIIVLILVVYEAVVLRGATSTKNTSSTQSRDTQTSQTTSAHINTQSHSTVPLQVPVSHPTTAGMNPEVNPESHQKAPSPASPMSSDVSRTSASSPQHNQSPGTFNRKESKASVSDAADSDSANTKSSKSTTSDRAPLASKSKSIHLPESAIEMETRGADDDPDIEAGAVRKHKSSLPGTNISGSSSSHDQKPLSKTTQSAEKGAEPGAGENFWNWFQETKGSDQQRVSKSLPCPEDNKRLCQMFYKYLRKYKIRKIFDVSCEKNFEWMGAILKKAGNELWGFKYYCSLWSGERTEDVRKKLGGLPFVEFDDAKWWRAGFASDAELLFAWDTLPHLAYGRVWNFFVKARKQDIKYVLVDNYPGILNDPSPKRNYLNLRKHPFRFPSAKEVAQNITEPGETAKRQLLFYETSMLPDNLQ